MLVLQRSWHPRRRRCNVSSRGLLHNGKLGGRILMLYSRNLLLNRVFILVEDEKRTWNRKPVGHIKKVCVLR